MIHVTHPIVQLTQVTKSFGKNSVLKGIDLSILPGKLYALLGKNGSGKSTLLRMLMRAETPDEGSISVFNTSLETDPYSLYTQIAYVSETLEYPFSKPTQWIFKHLSEFYPKWDEAIFKRVVQKLNLDLSKHYSEMSRGQKMQASFAAALAIQPKILIIDEVTAVLDASARFYFMSELQQLTDGGGTILLATNIASEVQHFAEHMILLDQGLIKFDLPLKEITRSFLKLRQPVGEDDPVFRDPRCVLVGVNSDRSSSFLIPVSALTQYRAENFKDFRGITAEEIFIYYTKLGDQKLP